MDTLWKDLRFGMRMLAKNPGFTLVAIMALALGIGANTAIFSVVNGVLLRPLPFPEPGRLLQVWETDTKEGGDYTVSPVNYRDWLEQSRTLEFMASYRYENLILTGADQPQRISGVGVTADFFRVLGLEPAQGRMLTEEDDQPGAAPVALMSHSLWQRHFAADPDLVGSTILLNSVAHTVVGILPPELRFPNSGVHVWRPMRLDYSQYGRGSHFLFTIARMGPDVSLQQAQVEMDGIAARLEQAFPDNNTDLGIALVPMHEEMVGSSRAALTMLMAAVSLVLLIACANVANLFLSRMADRQREIAVRTALGAGRWRLVRQLLTESLFLALLGGGLGLLLAVWGVELLLNLNYGLIPRGNEIGVDATVLGFTLLASVLTGVIFGLAPALQSTRSDLNSGLKEAGRGSDTGSQRKRLRGALVVAEVALSLILLIAGTLLLRSFRELQSIEPGFRPEQVLTMQIALPKAHYPDEPRQTAFYDEALRSIAALPGVERVGGAQDLPFSGSRSSESFEVEGRPKPGPGETLQADYRKVTPDYLRAMGVPLLRGRGITERDRADAPRVMLINESMARRFWPDEDPLGARVMAGNPAQAWEIVGIVGNIKHQSLAGAGHPEMYTPFFQDPARRLFLAVRTRVDAGTMASGIRAVVREIDPDQPVFDIQSMEARIARSIAPERMNSVLLGSFAGVALLLAAVGVYGVISHGVTQRTREIGLRMALGARPSDVLRLVTGLGMRLTLAGIVLGLLGSLALTRTLSSLLFGVSATDPASFLAAPLFLMAAALAACYFPARRATRVDPMECLRHE
jgi:putative ABC transport system permease protein